MSEGIDVSVDDIKYLTVTFIKAKKSWAAHTNDSPALASINFWMDGGI